jgi:hypothetical protein
MSGWRNLKQRMLDLDTFYHLEGLRLYVGIMLNATYEGGVQVGCVVLGERQYIQSIRKFREGLWFYNRKKIDEYSHSRIQPSIKRLESEKYEYGYVFTFRPTKDFACGDYLNWMGMSVKEDGCDDSGGDQLDDRADSGMSSCGEKDVNQERREPANRLKNLEKEEILENNNIKTTDNRDAKDVDRLEARIGHFVGRRGRGINPKLTTNRPRNLEKALEAYITPRESMQNLDDMLDGLEERVTGE